MYDVVAALDELDQIMWRTPQYAASIAPGDAVAIWRSGSDAGIVGVGRVVDYPGDRAEPAGEAKFTLSSTEAEQTTRAPIAVRPCGFVAKSLVAGLDGWAAHQIITAPMGTVFQVSDAQWATLVPHLPELLPKELRPPPFRPPSVGTSVARMCIPCRAATGATSTRWPRFAPKWRRHSRIARN